MMPSYLMALLSLGNLTSCEPYNFNYYPESCQQFPLRTTTSVNSLEDYFADDNASKSVSADLERRKPSSFLRFAASNSSSSDTFFDDTTGMQTDSIALQKPKAHKTSISLQNLMRICDTRRQDTVDEQELAYARLMHCAKIHAIIAQHHTTWTTSSVRWGAQKRVYTLLTGEGKKQCAHYIHDLTEHYLLDQLRDVWLEASVDHDLHISCEKLLDFYRKTISNHKPR